MTTITMDISDLTDEQLIDQINKNLEASELWSEQERRHRSHCAAEIEKSKNSLFYHIGHSWNGRDIATKFIIEALEAAAADLRADPGAITKAYEAWRAEREAETPF